MSDPFQPADTTLPSRARRYLAERGLVRTLLHIAGKLYRRIVPVRIPTHPFDLRHGTDTSGLIPPAKLISGHAHDAHNTAYWGTSPSLLRGSVAHWATTLAGTPFPIGQYTFVDIGCGKGRALMLASELPFQRILGVELNPGLVEIANRNLAGWKSLSHPCNDLAVLHADALEFPIPETPALLYLFNPFDLHVTRLLLERIRALAPTRRTPLDFIYARPEYAHLFDSFERMHLLGASEAPFTPEDTAADAFATKSQDYRIYRLSPASPPKTCHPHPDAERSEVEGEGSALLPPSS